MNINEILEYLPHRYPFLLIDKILSLEPEEKLVALKNVSFNEPFFQGHFPGNPIMPGVLILEALAQAGAVLAFKSTDTKPSDGIIHYFAGIDNARFKRVVVPGDQLILEVQNIKSRSSIRKVHGIAYVGDKIVCSADLMSATKEVSQ